MFCSGTSVPPLGHFGPQPSDPRPDKVGTEPNRLLIYSDDTCLFVS
jgi:hypothetical protein